MHPSTRTLQSTIIVIAALIGSACADPVGSSARRPVTPTTSHAGLSAQIPSLVGYYRMDGDLQDATTFAANGTLMGGPVAGTDRFGIPQMALSFDGVDDWGEIPGASTNGQAEGTINVWLNRVTVSTPSRCGRPDLAGPDPFTCQHNIFAKEGGPQFRAQYGGSPVDQFSFKVNGEAELWTGSLVGGFDSWRMYTFVWSASGKRVYLDGALVASSAAGYVSPPSGTLFIGHNSHPSLGYRERFEGLMDDLRIYSRALSESEINVLLSETPDPMSKSDCANGGWQAYGFRNQGQCIRYLNTGQDSRNGG